MSNQSSSHRSLCQALFLIAAIMFQSLALPGRDVVFAKAADPEMKTAGSPESDPQKRSPGIQIAPPSLLWLRTSPPR